MPQVGLKGWRKPSERDVFSRRELLTSILAASATNASARDPAYSFLVLGLLQPTRLALRPIAPYRLHCVSQTGAFVVEAGRSAKIDLSISRFSASGPNGADAAFELEVPDVLRRRYFGTLQINSRDGTLLPVITMPIDTAVESIVAAELPLVRASFASLWAQAIVSRSFLFATRAARHSEAFFCDTTHCQFLRSPAASGSRISRVVRNTSGLLLANGSTPFPPSYSAACGGRTEGGEREGFFYTAVDCPTCSSGRLERRGHGWGLCQEGAMDLACRGVKGREILAHYYPGSSLRYV